jgi:ATP-binding cassette subfamily B protein
MPFISVASDFETIHQKEYFEKIYNFFGLNSDIKFVIYFGIGLILFYIIRAILNLFYFYLLNRFSQGRYHLIAYRLFENYIGMDYKKFIDKNSSDLTHNIVNETSHLVRLISSGLFMMSEIFVFLLIYSLLLYVNWKMTILLSIFLGINVILMKLFISVKIKKAGEDRAKCERDFFSIINNSFGNFKIIKLKNKDKEILDKFAISSSGFANANTKSQTLIQFPRLFLEMVGFSLVAVIVIYLIVKYQTDIKGALPILMVFVLGLYRLLPSVNRIFTEFNFILFYNKSLETIHNELIYEPEELGDEKIEFNQKIELKNIYFEYVENKLILKNVNLTIHKGEKIGIVGESGSGKSTLIDIIIGLYRPNKGEVLINEINLNKNNIKSWRSKIGYIPQNIYLKDGNVAENVAFLEEIDEEKVKTALKKANILEFLETYHEGIYTNVGDNGIKLSGGQKQRIAIARAIYNDPEILVLDEATSALDSETEKNIMKQLYEVGKNKTMIIIAHRISTLDECDRVVKLEKGEIK